MYKTIHHSRTGAMVIIFNSGLSEENHQDTGNDGKECHSFDKGCSKDKGITDIADRFRLTGNGFQLTGPDLSDTDTCSDCSQTCSDGSPHGTYCDTSCGIGQHSK
jgi:hypothetical protein